jgi:hypothetical protein
MRNKKRNRLNGFVGDGSEETVRNGSGIISVTLHHRAEALRNLQGLADKADSYEKDRDGKRR